jgi:ApaG protein
MVTDVDKGIAITVKANYRAEHSKPEFGYFFFAYEITIHNKNSFPVQLLSRHWIIKDSNSPSKEVKGDGVVGVQPVLDSGQIHRYESACQLLSELGSMNGHYLFQNMITGEQFDVRIPSFNLEVPYKLN